ncbi:MAG: hypothetical protein EOO70_02615 [Myxococcaceae bacterium]|nr:MAG: hypothetical protein EOO70_02615 [Myxococcaceae bacterium]
MSTRPGHELCWHCDVCHLSMCPDCDTEGRACIGGHARSSEYERQLNAWLDGTRKKPPTAKKESWS